MKTTHSIQDCKRHQSILQLICCLHPHLLCDKFPHPHHPNPLSTADRICKSQVLRLAPSYNPHACVLPPAIAEASRAMVFALAMDSTFSESHQLTFDDVIVLLDSGTSCAVSNNELDFEYIQPIQDLELKGIISGLKVKGIGHVIWTFLDEFKNNTPICLTCLYVPGAPAHLLPPQQLSEDASATNGAWIRKGDHAKAFYNGSCIKFQYDSDSNLPIAWLAPGIEKFVAFCGLATTGASNDDIPISLQMLLPDNLMDMQRKLLCLHHHFGHQSMTTIQEWAQTGYHGVPPDIAKYKIPLCQGCQFSAAKRHSHKQDKGSLSKSTEEPGDFVSVDQMVAGTPSLIPFHAGSVTTFKHWYNCATLWCDHTSWFLWSHLQESTNAVTTLESKVGFKTFTR